MPGSLTTWKATLVAQKKGRYRAFAPLAQRLGLPIDDALSVELRIEHAPVKLELDIDSGAARGLVLTAGFEVPPGMPEGPYLEVRHETEQDRLDKQELTSHEVQVGHARFDEQHYLDSDASEAEVQRVLSREATRAAIANLLEQPGCEKVRLTTLGARVTLKGREDEFSAERVLAALEPLLVLRRGGGPRGERHAPRGQWLVSTMAIAFALSTSFLLFAHAQWDAGLVFPASLFVISGSVASFFARLFGKPAVSGDSGSGARLRTVTALAWLAGGALGAGSTIALNSLLDVAAPTVTHGVVEQLGGHEEEDNTWKVFIRWEDGSRDWYRVHHRAEVGDEATRLVRSGKFVRWGEVVRVR